MYSRASRGLVVAVQCPGVCVERVYVVPPRDFKAGHAKRLRRCSEHGPHNRRISSRLALSQISDSRSARTSKSATRLWPRPGDRIVGAPQEGVQILCVGRGVVPRFKRSAASACLFCVERTLARSPGNSDSSGTATKLPAEVAPRCRCGPAINSRWPNCDSRSTRGLQPPAAPYVVGRCHQCDRALDVPNSSASTPRAC